MTHAQSIALLFCPDLERDPAAKHIYDAFVERYAPSPSGLEVDGREVLVTTVDGTELLVVRTDDVVTNDYGRYLPVLNGMLGHCAATLVVNWHEGANAPDRILTVHATGDVPQGIWGRAAPQQMRALLRALEAERVKAGLEHFNVVTEPTHWSGVTRGDDPALCASYAVPTYDVEIGSAPAAWSSAAAAGVVARALPHVVDPPPAGMRSVLCAGGVHCEPAFSSPVLVDPDVGVSHILSSAWLVSGGYDAPEVAAAKLDRCVGSIVGGVDVIAVHAKLKGPLKDAFRALGERLGVPVVKHKNIISSKTEAAA